MRIEGSGTSAESRPHIAYFPPKIPLGCLMSLADLTRTALSSRLSLPGRLPPSPHLGDWQLGCSSCAGRTPPSRGASRWLPTADSLIFRSPVTLTTSCGPLSPLAWPPRWPYFRVTQKPARTFRPSLVPDAMSSRLRRVGVKPIPRVESPTCSKWDPRADSEPKLSATFYFEILPYCANKARPACWRGTTIVPGKVAPHQPTARGPANMSDGPFEVS